MFPIIDKRETRINIRKIMDCQGLSAKLRKTLLVNILCFADNVVYYITVKYKFRFDL